MQYLELVSNRKFGHQQMHKMHTRSQCHMHFSRATIWHPKKRWHSTPQRRHRLRQATAASVRHSRPTRLPPCFMNFDPSASLNDFGFQGKPAASSKSSITAERPSFVGPMMGCLAPCTSCWVQPSNRFCQKGVQPMASRHSIH